MTRCFSGYACAMTAFMVSASLFATLLDRAPAAAGPASLPDQELGRWFTVKAEDLPPPYTRPVVARLSLAIPYAG